jgi:hypothetical protein
VAVRVLGVRHGRTAGLLQGSTVRAAAVRRPIERSDEAGRPAARVADRGDRAIALVAGRIGKRSRCPTWLDSNANPYQ